MSGEDGGGGSARMQREVKEKDGGRAKKEARGRDGRARRALRERTRGDDGGNYMQKLMLKG